MNDAAFFRVEFLLLVFSSFILPFALYGYLVFRSRKSPVAVGYFGLILVGLSGLDVGLLRQLRLIAMATPSVLDDRIFASELTVTLYILPVVFAAVGLNLVWHEISQRIVAGLLTARSQKGASRR
jgi:hypothetical protein